MPGGRRSPGTHRTRLLVGERIDPALVHSCGCRGAVGRLRDVRGRPGFHGAATAAARALGWSLPARGGCASITDSAAATWRSRGYRLLPGLQQLRGYQRAWLRWDILAGLTVAAYLVPQVMAYGVLGAPGQHGWRSQTAEMRTSG